jgi:hypothetical protein
MTFTDWLEESRFKLDQYGLHKGGRSAALDFWGGALRHASHTFGFDRQGTNVYEKEWDVLLLLDTCRPDVMSDVADGYDFLPSDVPSLTSLGSTSWEFLDRTFVGADPAAVADTAYVCANNFSQEFGDAFEPDPKAFGLLDEVWRYGWDDDLGVVPPKTVTDRAVSVGRESDFDRLIVHYMQPHVPYRSLSVGDRADADERGQAKKSVWDLLQMGEMDRKEAWDAYRDNLRWVLDDGVAPLLENLDAETVVLSSDHGEAFGEWGLYGHYRHVPAPVLREVPWVEISAIDERTLEPEVVPEEIELEQSTLEDRLTALGYR